MNTQFLSTRQVKRMEGGGEEMMIKCRPRGVMSGCKWSSLLAQ